MTNRQEELDTSQKQSLFILYRMYTVHIRIHMYCLYYCHIPYHTMSTQYLIFNFANQPIIIILLLVFSSVLKTYMSNTKKSLHKEDHRTEKKGIAVRENTHKYFITKRMYPFLRGFPPAVTIDSHVPLRELEPRAPENTTRFY